MKRIEYLYIKKRRTSNKASIGPYSSDPNKRACTPYLFLTKIAPCTLLFGSPLLFIFLDFIRSCCAYFDYAKQFTTQFISKLMAFVYRKKTKKADSRMCIGCIHDGFMVLVFKVLLLLSTIQFVVTGCALRSLLFRPYLYSPFSVTNNSVGSRTAAASNVSHDSSVYVARKNSSRTNDVRCNRNGRMSCVPVKKPVYRAFNPNI